MKYLKHVVVAAGICFASLPASAADYSVYSPTSVYQWSGTYLGLVGGLGTTSSRAVDVAGYDHLGEVIAYDASGAFGGATAGHNWQKGRWVFGVEGDLAAAGIDGQSGSEYTGGSLNPARNDTFLSSSIGWIGTFRGRVGYVPGNGRFLLYVTGGVAVGGITNTVRDVATTNGPETAYVSKSSTRIGAVVGLGVEAALQAGWSLKAEYLYTDLGSDSVTGVSDQNSYAIDYRFGDKVNLFRVGLNKRF